MSLPGNLQIRRMVAHDLDDVIAVERQTGSAPHWAMDEYLALIDMDSSLPFKRNAIVADLANEIVGFAICRLVQDVAELESIVVLPAWRGMGLGRQLLAELARQAKELGAGRLDLEARESNAAAIRLYQGVGFQETGRRRGYYREPEEDAVLMSFIL